MTTSLPFSGTAPLLLFVAKATVLLVAALVATMPFRRATAGSRHLVWLAAVVGVLRFRLLSRVDSLRLGVLPSAMAFDVDRAARSRRAPRDRRHRAASLESVAPRLAPTPVLLDAESTRAGHQASPRVATVRSVPPFRCCPRSRSSGRSLRSRWSAGSSPGRSRCVASSPKRASSHRLIGRCRCAKSPIVSTSSSPPRLVISDRIEMAFACRALAPTIVLPAAAESWTDDRRRAVLFHELAHIKRHDLVGHTLGRLACALYWFHPLVWTAAKNLRAESERACDDLVLSCGARPSEYAQHLLDMVTSVRNHGAPHHGAADGA